MSIFDCPLSTQRYFLISTTKQMKITINENSSIHNDVITSAYLSEIRVDPKRVKIIPIRVAVCTIAIMENIIKIVFKYKILVLITNMTPFNTKSGRSRQATIGYCSYKYKATVLIEFHEVPKKKYNTYRWYFSINGNWPCFSFKYSFLKSK